MRKIVFKTICVFTLVFFVMSMTGAAHQIDARNDKFKVYENCKCFNVLKNDIGHGLKVATTGCITTEKGGKVYMKSNGNFIYEMPCPDFEGRDCFTYTAIDKFHECDTAKVTLKVV